MLDNVHTVRIGRQEFCAPEIVALPKGGAHPARMAKKPHYIREWRKHRGLTLEQLAERIGMTHQNLGKIERFKVPYTQSVLERLAEALQTDPASLVMRDASDPDGIWSIWDDLTPPERVQGIAILKAVKTAKNTR